MQGMDNTIVEDRKSSKHMNVLKFALIKKRVPASQDPVPIENIITPIVIKRLCIVPPTSVSERVKRDSSAMIPQ